MGEAKNRGTRDERIAAVQKLKTEHEEQMRLFNSEVGTARLKYGLDLGVVAMADGTSGRMVVVRFDELVGLLDKIWPKEDVELPRDFPIELTDEELAANHLDKPGTAYDNPEDAKRADERYRFVVDMKRARARVAAAVKAKEDIDGK